MQVLLLSWVVWEQVVRVLPVTLQSAMLWGRMEVVAAGRYVQQRS